MDFLLLNHSLEGVLYIREHSMVVASPKIPGTMLQSKYFNRDDIFSNFGVECENYLKLVIRICMVLYKELL